MNFVRDPIFVHKHERCPICGEIVGVQITNDGYTEHLICGKCNFRAPYLGKLCPEEVLLIPDLDETDHEPPFIVAFLQDTVWLFRAMWRIDTKRLYVLRDAPTWVLRRFSHASAVENMQEVVREANLELALRERRRQLASNYTPWWADPELYESEMVK